MVRLVELDPHDLLNSLPHFLGRLVGKGHRQNVFGAGGRIMYEISDAITNDAGLPAPRAGENESRAAAVLDGHALHSV